MFTFHTNYSTIREIVSLIYSNNSILKYVQRPIATAIQNKIHERKHDCLVLYSLDENRFDTIFLFSLGNVNRIVDALKKK